MHHSEWHYKLNQSISLTFTSVPSHSFQFTHQRYIKKRKYKPKHTRVFKNNNPHQGNRADSTFSKWSYAAELHKKKKEKGKKKWHSIVKNDISLWELAAVCLKSGTENKSWVATRAVVKTSSCDPVNAAIPNRNTGRLGCNVGARKLCRFQLLLLHTGSDGKAVKALACHDQRMWIVSTTR